MQNSTAKLNIKPFNFQLLQSEKLNEILLENLDLDQVIVNNDISSCATVLRNLVQADITADTIRSLSYEQFKKILTVSQTCIDFYTQNQEFQDQQITEQLELLRQKQEQLDKLQQIQSKHQSKEAALNAELEKLKKDAVTLKQNSIKNIVFKCHLCDKCFQSKDYLFSHIERAHNESQLEDVANPEYMAQMLKQIQTFKAQSEQQLTFGQFTQSKGFANSQQQFATGSVGFQELKQQQVDKIEEKRRRKEEREIKREKDRMERLERLRIQEYQMEQFQQSINKQLDAKYNHMLKLQNKQIQQVQQQSEEVRNTLFKIQEAQINMKYYQKDESVIQPVEQEQSKEEQQLAEDIEFLSQKSLNTLDKSADQKLLITKNQQIADQSGLPSFHNYSINDKSQINIKQNNEDAQKNNQMVQQQKLQSDMDHIGEMESDNDNIEDEQGRDQFIRPQNQQKQVKTATDDLIKAIYNKEHDRDAQLDLEIVEHHQAEINQKIQQERNKLEGGTTDKQDSKYLEDALNNIRKLGQPK